MRDDATTKEQLIAEVRELRERIAAMEASGAELMESHIRYKAIVDAIDGLVYLCSPRYEIEFANKRLIERSGFDPTGEKCFRVLHNRESVCPWCVTEKVLKGETIQWEILSPLDNRWYHIVNTPLRHSDGSVSKLALIRDITERRQTEEAVVRGRNKLETLLTAIGEGITVQDTEFRILYQNAAHKEKQGDHAGEYCYRAYQHRDTICEGCLLVKTFGDGKVHRRETSAFSEQGILYLEVSATPLRDAEGNIVAGIEVVRDITDRKKLEALLTHSQKMEAVGQLAGGIAHDFNNILTAIIGYGNLMQIRMKDNDPLFPYLREVLSAADRATHLTQGLLAFSRRQPMDMRPVSINAVIAGIRRLLERIIGEDIELKIFLSYDELVTVADSSQIEQVLMNLSANARDAMPGGGELAIRTKSVRLDEESAGTLGLAAAGAYACITVTDTGSGIDEHTQAQIFQPFFTTKEEGKGTGLGLSIAYGIIKQHKGHISVKSMPGEGTSFTLYLPCSRISPEESEPALRHSAMAGTGTILLAEDDTNVRRLTRSILEEFGYRVIEAVDGEDALHVFRENRDAVQLLLLDAVMPKKDGKEVYEEIRKNSPGIRVLFTSGYPLETLQKRGFAEKEFPFLPKPASPGELLKKVKEVLEK